MILILYLSLEQIVRLGFGVSLFKLRVHLGFCVIVVFKALKLQRQLIELLVNRGTGNIDDGIAVDDRTLHKQFDGLREENGVALNQFYIYLENTAAGSHIRGYGNDSLAVLNRAGSVLLCKVVSDYRVISDGDRGQIDIRAVLRQRKHEADAVGITFVYLNGF